TSPSSPSLTHLPWCFG
ncbi:rCG40933, partial [Rattus norvegicus]